MPRPRTAPLVVLLASLAVLLAGCLGGSPSADEEDPLIFNENKTRSFSWSASNETTGVVAVELRFRWTGTNRCNLTSGASGRRGGEPIHFWDSWRSDNSRGGSSYSTAWIVQAHHGDVVDTRDHFERSGHWGSIGWLEGPFTDGLVYRAAAFTVAHWDHPDVEEAPFFLDLSCEEPFHVVSQRAGRQGFTFLSDSLDNGTSATVGAGTGLAVQETRRGEITTPVVRFSARGGSNLASHGVSRLTLDHPNGSHEWVRGPDGVGSGGRTTFEGGPGHYEVTLDQAGGWWRGVVVGLRSVDSLETF